MAKSVDLIRLEHAPDGVFGVLRVDGSVHCLTLEPPERGNRPNVSCIPAGHYQCRSRESRRFGPTWEITNVPGRTDILFHAGNVASDTRGCVLLGERFGVLEGGRGVLDSRRAMATLRQVLGMDSGFRLRILAGEGVEADAGGTHG